MHASDLVLYEYWRSSCSWRVRWALQYKGISYISQHINLLQNEQNSLDFLRENPAGSVPALKTPTGVFSESFAMLEWLEERYPSPALLPQNPESRLYVRQLALTLLAGTQPLQNLSVQRYAREAPEARREWAHHWMHRGLRIYEALLVQHGRCGTYSWGSQLSFADLCLVPQCYNALRVGMDLGVYPILAGIYQRALATEACQLTHPDHHVFSVKPTS